MAKKQSASSARDKVTAKNAKHMPDNQIDFSDVPESTDEELKGARRVGRPSSGNAKQLIAIRIDPKLLSALRKLATKQDKPYQTLIHELLEKAAKKVA
jgi:uncharacterized protein (DUF4415 family)